MGRHHRGDDVAAHGRPESADASPPARPGETSGAWQAQPGRPRRNERSGAWPAQADGRSGSWPAQSPGETTGGRQTRSGEPSGAWPVQPAEAVGRCARGDSTVVRRPAGAPGTTDPRTRPGERTGSHRTVPGETTGSHRAAPGETTGSHRVLGEARRGIAKWPLVAGGLIVLVVLGLLGWGWADSILASRAEAQASACTEGESNLSVAAAPAVAPAVTAAAQRWNQERTVVHAHCVHVAVETVDDQAVVQSVTGQSAPQPQVWVAADGAAVTQAGSANPALLTSPPEPLRRDGGYPCAVLSIGDEVQQRAAQVFRNYLQEPAQQAEFDRLGP